MKTKIILTISAALLAAATINLNAGNGLGNGLLSPRAAGNQIKVTASAAQPATIVAAALPASYGKNNMLPPRAVGNQIIHVRGVETVTAKCKAFGSPKYLETAGNAAKTSCCGMTIAECPNMATCGSKMN